MHFLYYFIISLSKYTDFYPLYPTIFIKIKKSTWNIYLSLLFFRLLFLNSERKHYFFLLLSSCLFQTIITSVYRFQIFSFVTFCIHFKITILNYPHKNSLFALPIDETFFQKIHSCSMFC